MMISRTKAEYMSIGAQDDGVELAGVEIKKIKAFTFLGFVVQGDGHGAA